MLNGRVFKMEIGGGGCLTHFPGKPGSCKRHMKLQVSSSLLCCLRIIKEKRESEKQRMTETTRGCGERDRHTLWFSALQCCETPHQNPPALWITQLRGKKKKLSKKVQRMLSDCEEAYGRGSIKPMLKFSANIYKPLERVWKKSHRPNQKL